MHRKLLFLCFLYFRTIGTIKHHWFSEGMNISTVEITYLAYIIPKRRFSVLTEIQISQTENGQRRNKSIHESKQRCTTLFNLLKSIQKKTFKQHT